MNKFLKILNYYFEEINKNKPLHDPQIPEFDTIMGESLVAMHGGWFKYELYLKKSDNKKPAIPTQEIAGKTERQ
jgi:hypothetical protein